jgi:flavin-dependent dehydrogenase
VDADVVIAGGGLAGASTALALARHGLSSVVVDKAEFPRDKPCGEGLLPHGLDLLRELGLGDVVDACGGQPFRGILYRCHGVVARGDFEDDMRGRGVRRRLLDEALRARAVAAGVTLRAGLVRTVELGDDSATLHLADGASVKGRFLVGADGPRSIVRHELGLDGGPPGRPRYALRQHFTLPPGTPLPDRVEVNVVDGYELYVTPCAPDTVGVAALCEKRVMHDGGGKPDARMARLIEACAPVAERLSSSKPESPALACGPLRVRSRDVGKGRAFLVGDAAGYVDAITGEGMSLALKTAVLVADAIAEAAKGVSVDEARAGYRKKRMAAFRDHALLTFGLVELARHPFFARRAIARLAKEPALFSRLLSVNNGTKSLTSLGAMDFVKLAVGASPSTVSAALTTGRG